MRMPPDALATAVRTPADVVRVVLADDTAEIRLLLRKCFELDGSVEVVGEASNGVEAIEVVEQSRPDVILLDLAMPVMDGLQAMSRIQRSFPETKIVVLSAFNASKMEQRALAAGASAFISKGTSPDAILAVVHEVAGARRPSTVVRAEPAAPSRSVENAYPRQHDLLPLLTHELGNQLTVIQGFAELLVDGSGDLPAETSRQFAEAIVRNARQMGDLLEAVAQVRKLDLGTMELNPVDVDLADLVQRAIPDLAALLGDRPVTVTMTGGGVVRADPLRIRQILTNLISNAGKFTPPGTTVAVELREAGQSVELSVSDDGPGIPVERHGELFQKFSRLDTTVEGTGVGLYLSRGIARAHGGDVSISPRSRGCRFTLRLPRVERRSEGR